MATPLSSYQKRLFVFLSVASFFEGYDFLALTQILPNLRADMDLSPAWSGYLLAFINVGTVVAFLLIRKGDQWGRRRLLMLTIAGYTLFTALTGLSVNVYMFGLCQFVARIFLIAEWAISMVYAAEEFPAERRGMVIGVIQAVSTVGGLVCVGVTPSLLALPLGWRGVYFVGIVPLLLLAFARRNLRETERFDTARKRDNEARPSFTRILRSPYKKRMLQLALIWGATYICTNNAVAFWKEFAVGERGLTDAQVRNALLVAAVGSLPLVFLAGKLIDRFGRRGGASIIFVSTAIGVFGAYTAHSPVVLTASLLFAMFGVTAVLPVLNAYTTELFPTELRSDAFAWSNNLIGRIGYVISPLFIGVAAESMGFGPPVAITVVGPLIGLGLILWLFPETSGRELEETSAV